MRILALVFIASLVAGAAANPVRALTGRARPNAKVQPGWHGPFSEGRWVVGKHKYSSFPSAHMAVVVAMAVPLMLYGRRAGLLGAGVAAAVGWSRIYLNAHHLSDVAAGLMLGLGCGLALCLSPVVHFWLGAALTAAAERWRRLAVPTPSPPAAAPASRCQLQTS
jgi:undecaprenyl-diphosphatase